MILKFLGTKGCIEEQTADHKYHSSLLIKEQGFKLLIDHGLESQSLAEIKPDVILITHAHPDHFIWLKKDEDYQGKIYLTEIAQKSAIFQKNFVTIKPDKSFRLGPFKIITYEVIHSLRAPAVGFKISADSKTFVYNPDIIAPINKNVLKNIDLYIGDGSTVTANLIRRKDDQIFGHTRIQTQINWCKNFNIKKVIFTHFGKEALRIGDRKLEKDLKQEDMELKIAHDGMEYKL